MWHLLLISSKFPIGVETIYKPTSKVFISLLLIFILSCAPVNNSIKKIILKDDLKNTSKSDEIAISSKKIIKSDKEAKISALINLKIKNDIEIILPKFYSENITKSLINSFELSVYIKEIDNLQININQYMDLDHLVSIMSSKASPGKIFVGTLNEEETKIVKDYCKEGILFFAFSSNKDLAGDCVYLVNFFPEDDLRALFNFFPEDTKIALLYPENFYGYSINSIIDLIAEQSKSIVINRISYKEDLSNAREAIKELGKYELRKKELERQKNILISKSDESSKEALKKIQKFETLGNLDFTHIILPDYGIRLLEIAPLLPFYDVDPKKIQFVGTGVWDDSVFFDEPSLQGAIFSGIEQKKRREFFNDYYYVYKEKPIRIITIPYDLIGLISYLINENLSVSDTFVFLDNGQTKFDGVDGKFYFLNNIIYRELNILEIKKGTAVKLN